MNRTHRVDLYRPTITKDSRGHETKSWPKVPTTRDVEGNLQPRSGGLLRLAFGREIDGSWAGFFPPGTAVEEGDGLKVTAVLEGGPAQPSRFEVKKVRPMGARWDTEVDLDESQEKFG